MREIVRIEIPGIPLPWKAPYVGAHGAYSPRTALMHQLRQIVKPQVKSMLPKSEKGLRLDVDFFLPIAKSTSKKKREKMLNGEIRPTKTPDRSNLLKLLEDLLQGVAYENDCLIVEGETKKFYDENPRTVIDVKEL
jgi:Holliday junction resolvase RusA-like endonuclease